MTNLTTFAAKILHSGPARVLVNGEEAVSTSRARSQFGINPGIIFIRNDGWSLGAPLHLHRKAHALWADEWIGVLLKPSLEPQTIERYRRMLLEGFFED